MHTVFQKILYSLCWFQGVSAGALPSTHISVDGTEFFDDALNQLCLHVFFVVTRNMKRGGHSAVV